MKHIIQIDDRTVAGKQLLGIAQTISEQNKGVVILDERVDAVPFEVFADELRTSVKKRLTKKAKT